MSHKQYDNLLIVTVVGDIYTDDGIFMHTHLYGYNGPYMDHTDSLYAIAIRFKSEMLGPDDLFTWFDVIEDAPDEWFTTKSLYLIENNQINKISLWDSHDPLD